MGVCHKICDMSSHGGNSHAGGERVCIPALSLDTANEMSWMLGERLTREDDRTTLVGEWRTPTSRQSVALFEVTSETAVLRYRSPVGREHYFGTTLSEARQTRAELADAPEWSRTEK